MTIPPSCDCFFYGTLIDNDILAAVAGPRAALASQRPATVDGYRRLIRKGAVYPILRRAPGMSVAGIVVFGLNPAEMTRLVSFEGPEYELRPLTVMMDGNRHQTMTFLPKPWVPASTKEWRLETWRRLHKPRFLNRILTTGGH
ncbi:MAG: gamma-glutamylcyclotransferase [Rhodospirillales bacterium]|nr:gamma-glutamylcyclotransferase [Rhodospirillales bacterium]